MAGFTKAKRTVAVEWNPKLPENKSIKKPKKKAYTSKNHFGIFRGKLSIKAKYK